MKTGYCQGIEGVLVDVGDARQGLSVHSARETRIRVRSALGNLDIASRIENVLWGVRDKIPGSVPGFDLAIALDLIGHEEDAVVVGELSLSGDVRPVRAIVPILLAARRAGIQRVIIPWQNWHEAQIVGGMNLVPVSHIADVLHGVFSEPPTQDPHPHVRHHMPTVRDLPLHLMDAFQEVSLHARGGSSVLMIGSPGSGKTMIARRIPNELGAMDDVETMSVAAIRSAAGLGRDWHTHPLMRPFRAPHHTASKVSLTGGGLPRARPGEVTLAHLGILFLDEVSEFARSSLDGIAACVAKGSIEFGRLQRIQMPSRPVVIAAMNPCPCGWHGHPTKECKCSEDRMKRFNARTEWFVDRLDMKPVNLPILDRKAMVSRA